MVLFHNKEQNMINIEELERQKAALEKQIKEAQHVNL